MLNYLYPAGCMVCLIAASSTTRTKDCVKPCEEDSDCCGEYYCRETDDSSGICDRRPSPKDKEDCTQYGDHCFKLFVKGSSHIEAEIDCQRRGGTLAEIHSTKQNTIMQRVSACGKAAIGLMISDRTMTWRNGSKVDFVFWKDGEPKLGAKRLCTLFDGETSLWRTENCSKTNPYICQYYDGMTILGSIHYKLYTTERTHVEAEEDCRTRGGHLASIHSEIQDSVLQSIEQRGHAWIGIYHLNEQIKYTDLSPYDYEMEFLSRGSLYFEKSCGEINGKLGRVTLIDCNKTRSYICQFSSAQFAGKHPEGCPKEAGDNNCYKIHVKPFTSTLENCCQICSNSPKCTAYAYWLSKNNCYLEEEGTAIEKYKYQDCIAGMKRPVTCHENEKENNCYWFSGEIQTAANKDQCCAQCLNSTKCNLYVFGHGSVCYHSRSNDEPAYEYKSENCESGFVVKPEILLARAECAISDLTTKNVTNGHLIYSMKIGEYVLGIGNASVLCDDEFTPDGPSVYKCRMDSTWDAPFTTKCVRASYQYFPRSKNYRDAREFCVSMGGDLVSIHSPAMMKKMLALLEQMSPDIIDKHVWIGLNDRKHEGLFVWTDGTVTNYLPWKRGEPDNWGGDENCGQIWVSGFNDEACSLTRPFICTLRESDRYKATLAQCAISDLTSEDITNGRIVYSMKNGEYVSGIENASVVCNDDFTPDGPPFYMCKMDSTWDGPFTTKCVKAKYKYFLQKRNYHDARECCVSMGGDLVSIHSPAMENKMLALLEKMSAPDAWIGLNDRTREGQFVWTDGTIVDYLSWIPGQPDNWKGHEDCGEISVSGYNDDVCDFERPFICTLKKSKIDSGGASCEFEISAKNCYGFPNIGHHKARTAAECCRMCQEEHRCRAFAFYTAFQTCYLAPGSANLNKVSKKNCISGVVRKNFSQCAIPNLTTVNIANGQLVYSMRDGDTVSEGENISVVCNDNFIPEGQPVYICKGDSFWDTPFATRCIQAEFRYFSEKRNFQDARASCVAQGGDIVSIHNEGMDEKIRTLAIKKSGDDNVKFWIGLNDRSHVGLYVWADGTNPNYQPWAPGNPDEEDCVESAKAGWNDLECNELRPYICAFKNSKETMESRAQCAISDLTTENVANGHLRYSMKIGEYVLGIGNASVLCDDDFTPDGPSVYRCRMDSTWDASFTTKSQSRKKLTVFPDMVDKRVWIGLNDRTQEGLFVWTDGTIVDYLSWKPGQPDNWQGDEDCGEIRVPGFNDDSCSYERPFICTFKESDGYKGVLAKCAISELTTKDIANGHLTFSMKNGDHILGLGNAYVVCDDNFTPDGPSVYRCRMDSKWDGPFRSECVEAKYQYFLQQKNYHDARDFCISMGGDLVSIHSPAIMAKILALLEKTFPNIIDKHFWIGLNDREREGLFVWTDGTIVNYLPWLPGQPDDYWNYFKGDEDCGEIHASGFNDEACSLLRPFICTLKKSKTESANSGQCAISNLTTENIANGQLVYSMRDGDSVSEVGNVSVVCDDDFISDGPPVYRCQHDSLWDTPFTTKCVEAEYHYFPEAKSFQDARSSCVAQGGDIVSVHSPGMAEKIRTAAIKKSGNDNVKFWIGLNDRTHKGLYVWTDGTNANYQPWAPGNPNDHMNPNTSKDEDCVESTKGGWNDLECIELRPYICAFKSSKETIEFGCHKNDKENSCYVFIGVQVDARNADECCLECMATPECNLYMFENGMCFNTGSDTDIAYDSKSETCESGFIGVKAEYRYFPEKKTFQDARASCVAQGGDLVSIRSAKMGEKIWALATKESEDKRVSFWIGLNDRKNERLFVWTDGTNANYQHWTAGNPDDSMSPYTSEDEDCVEFVEGGWNDVECSDLRSYICTFKK